MKKTTETKPSRSEPKGEWIDSCDGEASAVRALRNSGLKPWRLRTASPPSAPLSADFTPLKPAGPRGATCSPRFNSFLSCWGPLEPPGRRAPPEPVPGAESGHRVGQPDLRHVTNPAAAWTPREHHLASESARPGEPSPRPSKGRRGRSNPPGGLRFPRSSSPPGATSPRACFTAHHSRPLHVSTELLVRCRSLSSCERRGSERAASLFLPAPKFSVSFSLPGSTEVTSPPSRPPGSLPRPAAQLLESWLLSTHFVSVPPRELLEGRITCDSSPVP